MLFLYFFDVIHLIQFKIPDAVFDCIHLFAYVYE